jgi:hypothetical protein
VSDLRSFTSSDPETEYQEPVAMTVGMLIAALKGFDSATPVVIIDTDTNWRLDLISVAPETDESRPIVTLRSDYDFIRGAWR